MTVSFQVYSSLRRSSNNSKTRKCFFAFKFSVESRKDSVVVVVVVVVAVNGLANVVRWLHKLVGEAEAD